MARDKVGLEMDAPAVRGRARVQLFDGATGDLVEDQAHDNFVSERWLRAIARFANWGAFAYRKPNGTSQDTVMNGSEAFRTAPFGGMALTDYAGAPDQDERVVQGIPSGHASKGVAGGGSWRGAYNQAESVHRFGYHKFVYDFSTSEANGTFQSIYTGNFDSAGSTTARTKVLPQGGILTSDGWGLANKGDEIVIDPVSGTMYHCQDDQVGVVTDWTPIAFGNPPTVETWQPLTPKAERRAFTTNNGRLYWLSGTFTKVLISAPLSDLQNTTVEKEFNPAWVALHGGGSMFYVNDIVYHPGRNEFLICNAHASGPKFEIMTFDPDTFADGDKFGIVGNPRSTYLGAWESYDGVVSTGKGAVLQLSNDGSVVPVCDVDQRLHILGKADLMLTATSNVDNNFKPAAAQLFFSRALLDEPVTKTVQNTMKITYEFTFDPPSLS